MFRLTKQEQLVVAFLVGALLLGTAVQRWRELHSPTLNAKVEPKGR